MSVLGKPSPADLRPSHKTRIIDIETCDVIAENYTKLMPLNMWPWIIESVSEHFDCNDRDVRNQETEDGDVITVFGKPVAYVEGEYHPPVRYMQEAAE